MNNNEYNNSEPIVDVPYYTRDLCKDNQFKLSRRIIRSNNILKYKKEINEINCGKDYFQTIGLKKIDSTAIKILK